METFKLSQFNNHKIKQSKISLIDSLDHKTNKSQNQQSILQNEQQISQLQQQLLQYKQKNKLLKQTVANLNLENTRLVDQTDEYQRLNQEAYIDISKIRNLNQQEKELSTQIIETLKGTHKQMSYKTQTSVIYNITQKMEKMEKQYKKLEKVCDSIYKSAEYTRLLMKEYQDIDSYFRKNKIDSMRSFLQKMSEMEVAKELQQRKIDELESRNNLLESQNQKLKMYNMSMNNKHQKNKQMMNNMIKTQTEMKEMIVQDSKKMHDLKMVQEFNEQELQFMGEQNELLSKQLGTKDMIIRDYENESSIQGSSKKYHLQQLKMNDLIITKRSDRIDSHDSKPNQDNSFKSNNNLPCSSSKQYVRNFTKQMTTDFCFSPQQQNKLLKKVSVDISNSVNKQINNHDKFIQVQKNDLSQSYGKMFMKLNKQKSTPHNVRSFHKI